MITGNFDINRRPYIRGIVSLPRFAIRQPISFLLDTDTDYTCRHLYTFVRSRLTCRLVLLSQARGAVRAESQALRATIASHHLEPVLLRIGKVFANPMSTTAVNGAVHHSVILVFDVPVFQTEPTRR